MRASSLSVRVLETCVSSSARSLLVHRSISFLQVSSSSSIASSCADFLFCPRFLPNKLLRKSLFQEKKKFLFFGGGAVLFCFCFCAVVGFFFSFVP